MIQETEDTSFVNKLPKKLQVEISMYLNENKYKKIEFLRNKSKPFLYWICPRLEYLTFHKGQYVYKDRDNFDAIYFIIKGGAWFVLE